MMKRIIVIFLGACSVFVILALALPLFIDVNAYKPEILAKAKKTLGRDMTIEGKISLRLLPFPELFIDKIQLANAAEGSQPYMASIDRVELRMAWFPLFRKKVEIGTIKLVRPYIFLERLKTGRGNWEFSPFREKEAPSVSSAFPMSPASSSSSFDMSIKRCEMTKGELEYKEEKAVYTIHNISSNIHLDSLKGPFYAKGQFDYADDQTVHFDADLGVLKDTQPLSLIFRSSNSEIKMSGTLNPVEKSYQGKLVGTGEWENLAKLAGMKVEPPAFLGKKLDAKMEINASPEKIALDKLSLHGEDLSLGGQLSILLKDKVQIQGALKGGLNSLALSLALKQEKDDIAGSLKANVKDLKSFLQHINYDTKGIPENFLKASSLFGHFSVTPLGIKLSDLNLDVSSAKVTGEMTWFKQRSKPSVYLDIHANNLNPFLALLNIKMKGDQSTTGSLKGKIDGDLKDLTFNVHGTLESASVVLQGKARELGQKANFDTNFNFKSTSFIDVLKRFDITLPALFNHLAMSGKVTGDFSEIQVDARTELKDFNLLTRGFIHHLDQKPNFDLHISARHPDVRRLLGALGASVHTTSGPFTLETHLEGTASLFKLADIKGILGQAGSFSGTLAYAQSSHKPHIDTTLHFKSINLDHLLSFLKDSVTVPTYPHIMLAAAASSSRSPWSKEPLDLKFLNYFDADLKLNSEQMSKKDIIFAHPALILQIKNGILKIDHATASVYGGNFSLKGQTDSQKNNLSHYVFSLKDADLKTFSPKEGLIKIVRGRLDVMGDLTASGNSLYNLVSALKGSITLDARDGTISGFDLQAITSNLMKQNRLEGVVNLLSTSFRKGETPFSSLEGLIEIHHGIAHIKKLKLLAKGGEGTAEGSINLPEYTVNAKAQFQLTDLKNSPVIGVTLTGNPNAPHRTIDSAALQNYMATNVLKGLIDSLGAGKEKPADIIGAIIGGGENDKQKPSSQEAPNSSQPSDLGNIVKKPEEAIKGLLKGLF